MSRPVPVRLALTFALLLATGISAAEDNPAKAPRRTGHDHFAAVLKFNRETLVGAYDKSGKRDPKWDEPARALLEATAQAFSCSVAYSFYWPAPPPTPANRLELARKAIDAGCDDPLVLYCYQNALEPTDRMEALKVLRKAAEGIKAGDYPALRGYGAWARLANASGNDDERQSAAKLGAEYRVKMLCGPMDDGARRMLLHLTWGDLSQPEARREAQRLVDALDARPDADPWLRDTFAGRLHVKLAWDARGGGWADSVTEPGWKAFARNLASARDRLVRAWKAAPHLPEAPTEMIAVCMGAGGELNEDAMNWFRRATAAQADYGFAYNSIYNALLPRWGGSHEKMMEVALACVEAGDYDTLRPWQFVTCLEEMRRDIPDWGKLLADPTRYDAMVRVTEGYAAARKDKGDADWFKSYHAAAAWAAGKHGEAKKVLEELGDHADPRPFQALGARDGAEAILETYALAGPHAATLARAAAALDGGDAAAAAKAYADVEAKLDAADRARPFVQARARNAAAAAKFAAGGWADLQPAGSLGDWKRIVGTWHPDADGALVGGAENKASTNRQKALVWASLLLGADEPFEMTGHLEFAAEPGDAVCAAGVAVVADDNDFARGYVLADAWRGEVVHFFGANPPTAPAEVKRANDFLVRFDGKTFAIELNGKPAGQPFPIPADKFANRMHVGVGGVGTVPVKFTKLRLRKLPANPPPQ